ncbi:MAG: 3'-5' exonuclease domain-containing protein 2 [Magnetococcales bacterium]|nr:3'-5' exonuclease domain-containing protein 2 [Magnetococcales bacterium]
MLSLSDGDFLRKLDKDEVNELPVVKWTGPIHLVANDDHVAASVAAIRQEKVLGFDTETKPTFKKGQQHHPALVQLAGEESVFLFRIGCLRQLEPLQQLLSDPAILKVGVGLGQDVAQLQAVLPFSPGGFLDLGEEARKAGLKNRGLRTLAAGFFGVRISKRAQCSNWSTSKLQPYQISYAATDAWISREIYLTMERLGLLDPAFQAEMVPE